MTVSFITKKERKKERKKKKKKGRDYRSGRLTRIETQQSGKETKKKNRPKVRSDQRYTKQRETVRDSAPESIVSCQFGLIDLSSCYSLLHLPPLPPSANRVLPLTPNSYKTRLSSCCSLSSNLQPPPLTPPHSPPTPHPPAQPLPFQTITPSVKKEKKILKKER